VEDDDDEEDEDEEDEEAPYMAGAVALLRSCPWPCASFAACGTDEVDDDAVLSLWFGEFPPVGGTSTGEPVWDLLACASLNAATLMRCEESEAILEPRDLAWGSWGGGSGGDDGRSTTAQSGRRLWVEGVCVFGGGDGGKEGEGDVMWRKDLRLNDDDDEDDAFFVMVGGGDFDFRFWSFGEKSLESFDQEKKPPPEDDFFGGGGSGAESGSWVVDNKEIWVRACIAAIGVWVFGRERVDEAPWESLKTADLEGGWGRMVINPSASISEKVSLTLEGV
jgi:hypothetical protein